MEYVKIACLVVYITASLCLMLYGSHCYVMLFLFLRRQKSARIAINDRIDTFWEHAGSADLPIVTVQLPIYNEAEVVERLIESAGRIDYPSDKLEIQVIDDSSDETREIVDAAIAALSDKGIDAKTIRRVERNDFKAGALANAMKSAKGEFIAMFDADFVIPENFLKRTVALILDHDKTACVQGRWEHLNRNENWLTRAQSVGIDGHFAAEQGARSYHKFCMNFNGTAGLWRKNAILAGGGWQGDTLTEDLDLSYRVQMAGYRIEYDFDLKCPAEIPNNIASLKSQQKRWAKGSIETAIKLMPAIVKSKQLRFSRKVEAFIHLTHYTVALLMTILCLCTLPVLLWIPMLKNGWLLGVVWFVIVISAIAPCVMYTGSGIVLKRGFFALSHFPAMLSVGTGLCLNNALAVLEALAGRKSPFVRTPKSGSSARIAKNGRYNLDSNVLLALTEITLGVYCAVTFLIYLQSGKYVFGFFIAAYAFGLLTFGLTSIATQLRLLPQTINSGGVKVRH